MVLYVALAGLIASNPEGAFGFWPGVQAGGLWHVYRRTSPTIAQDRRRVWIAGVFLAMGFVLVMIPQRDIPTGAPFGALVTLTGALALGRCRAIVAR